MINFICIFLHVYLIIEHSVRKNIVEPFVVDRPFFCLVPDRRYVCVATWFDQFHTYFVARTDGHFSCFVSFARRRDSIEPSAFSVALRHQRLLVVIEYGHRWFLPWSQLETDVDCDEILIKEF